MLIALLGIILFCFLGGVHVEKKLLLLKEIEDDYQRAYRLVSYLFQDRKDKAGDAYVEHLIRVSDRITSHDAKVAALLHDVVEDIPDFTFQDLESLNFSSSIIDIVKIVTKDKSKNLSYHDWISEILSIGNDEAIKVKYSDMMDNFDLNRLNRLDEDTKRRLIMKYKDELERLKMYLDNNKIVL